MIIVYVTIIMIIVYVSIIMIIVYVTIMIITCYKWEVWTGLWTRGKGTALMIGWGEFLSLYYYHDHNTHHDHNYHYNTYDDHHYHHKSYHDHRHPTDENGLIPKRRSADLGLTIQTLVGPGIAVWVVHQLHPDDHHDYGDDHKDDDQIIIVIIIPLMIMMMHNMKTLFLMMKI